MIGDKDQLGSVGPGNVFKEMIESGVIPVTVLDACFRQEEGSTIVENARRINRNQTQLVYDENFQFRAASKPEDAAEIIQKIYEQYWRENGKRTENIQVLSPFRKNTAAGSDALNESLREMVNPKRRGLAEIKNGNKLFRAGDVVMQTENKDDISNGDLGDVLGIYRKNGKMVMQVDFGDDRVVEFADDDYWPLTLGYAMSVHKSQGNECPVVIMPLLGCFWRMLQRNILYTGITRATQKVILVGSKQAIAKAIHNNKMAKRNTNFAKRLRSIYKSKQELYKKSA
jgi:ATP-dependent exoDNAse (exonuclease V), alpha subunit - helicase superfamily I member